MENKEIVSVSKKDSGERIDSLIAAKNDNFTRSSVQKLLSQGNITVNDKKIFKNYRVQEGDLIKIIIPEPVNMETVPENIPIDIVYEDNDLLVVNKPKGMVVHPAAGNYSGTLVNALLYYCGESLSGINGVLRPGIVHRIDKDTSGLLIVAKNDFAHKGLAEQIKIHSFTRKYRAVVFGNIKEDSGTIDAPIGRHPIDRKKMAVTYKNSRNAVTHYKVIARYPGFTYLELKLETGRTHQIRVHMAHIGHPVAGDTVYGSKKAIESLNGQCLHAYYIEFVHPCSGKTISLSAPLPEYFENFLKNIDK